MKINFFGFWNHGIYRILQKTTSHTKKKLFQFIYCVLPIFVACLCLWPGHRPCSCNNPCHLKTVSSELKQTSNWIRCDELDKHSNNYRSALVALTAFPVLTPRDRSTDLFLVEIHSRLFRYTYRFSVLSYFTRLQLAFNLFLTAD